MKKIRFYGRSDDLAYVDDGGDLQEYGAWNGTQFNLISARSEQRMKVGLDYPACDTGCWAVFPVQWDEDEPLPDWKFSYENEHGYSVALVVECPGDTTVTPAQD